MAQRRRTLKLLGRESPLGAAGRGVRSVCPRWGRGVTSTEVAPYRLVHGVVGVLGMALTPLVFQRLGPAMGAYVLVSLLVPLSGSELEGIGRYTLVLFPLFMAVATIDSVRLRDTIVIVSTLFLTLFVALHRIY